MDGEDDHALLSSLGVTSANVEDVERKVLAESETVLPGSSESGAKAGSELSERQGTDKATNPASKLYGKLHAIELEINAVASGIAIAKHAAEPAEECSDRKPISNKAKKENIEKSAQVHLDGSDLQQALAAERLRSLKKAKAQIEKELSVLNPSPSTSHKNKKESSSKREQEKSKLTRPLKPPGIPSRKSSVPVKTVSYDEDSDFDSVLDAASSGFTETRREELVRKGLLTPFHKLKGFEKRVQQGGPSAVPDDTDGKEAETLESASIARVAQSMRTIFQARPTTKLLDENHLPRLEAPTRPFQRLKAPTKSHISAGAADKKRCNRTKRPLPGKRWRKANSKKQKLLDEEELDEDTTLSDIDEENTDAQDSLDSEGPSFVTLEGGLNIPCDTYEQLFDYQKVGVQWLWELHCQRAGGIIGDEMGLGKTVQVIVFLGALHFSEMYKPSIVICPVTLLEQWRREVNKWYPDFEVEILHDSANGVKKARKSKESEYESEESWNSVDEEPVLSRSTKKWDNLISRVVNSEAGLLLTTYEHLRILGEKLLDIEWGYAILDEGHRIRNPNAEITLVCKQLQTIHRVIMTGAPIQNKLSELWSLFDFVFPGKLGVLPVFEAEFATPITIGGYANATPLQVSTAYRCAVMLRDLVMPYLLRRMKADVNAQLPKKTEHVLFCSLTADQRSVYRAFLASSEVEQIFDGSRNSLSGIDVLRKICNHPDLLEREHIDQHPDYGNPERSGKMKVVEQVLKVWKEQGHRVLLFTQTQQMLDIIESFLGANSYVYRRMDGLTPAKLRMALIDEFNNTDEVYIFIMTTKVGGLGTNLTGANRVIIYDPDWNPSTDMQARERAWRIGQTRDVTVYRLITRGTIEEKVYHRQIYKHFLTNKVLKNPQQRRFFKARDLKDLFTLQDDIEDDSTETSNIFGELSSDLNVAVDPEKRQGSSGILSGEAAGGASTNEQKADDRNGVSDDETNILKSLFDASGIHSAVNHDIIMNANEDQKLRLEEQASQVAQRAAMALRESRMIRSCDSFAVPTWTGKAGAAGAPAAIRRKFGSTVNSKLAGSSEPPDTSNAKSPGFSVGASSGKALSSAELLSRIRQTRESATSDALDQDLDSAPSGSHRGRSSSRSVIVQPEIMIRQLCSFMQQRGGSADSASITGHFKDRIRSEDLVLFKRLLREIAALERTARGSSEWVLKAEFREEQ